MEASNRNLNKHSILQLILTQIGWEALPLIIITARIRGTIHNPTIEGLQELKILNFKIYNLMDTFSKIAIRYLTHIILDKGKLEKKQALLPLE
jgi:hypothetical protein